MPEGHTIHRIAKDHTRLLVGLPVRVSSPQGRFAADAAVVDGAELRRIEAYGKHLFYWWSTGQVGHVHLGLFGKFRVTKQSPPPEPRGQVRMRMTTERATVDLSGPTACAVETKADRDAIVARLGPDPLRRDADAAAALAKIVKTRKPIGAVLLDQSVIAGVGNVYRAEALFVNGIHPERPGASCSTEEVSALWNTVVGMLRQGVKDNRIITVAAAELDAPRAGRIRRGEATYVYHRDRCLRCGTAVRTVTLAGRSCYYCPTCQP
jgi:endonuclease VIII